MSSALRRPSVRLATVDHPGGNETEPLPPLLECSSEYVVATVPLGATSTMVPWAALALLRRLDPNAHMPAANTTAARGTRTQPSPGRRRTRETSHTPGPATAM